MLMTIPLRLIGCMIVALAEVINLARALPRYTSLTGDI